MSDQIQFITLLTVIGNLILQPILRYMLHSRCDQIKLCGCVDIHRVVETDDSKKGAVI